MMRSPEQQFAMAKRLPIPELAKVLQGQSDVVDMSIAEMVLRQKMQAQKAQQGMAAQPTAQQPKVVEQDLMRAQQMMQPQAQQMSQSMMDRGVAALPADVDVPEFAGGGIVSFSRGGLSQEEIDTNRLREEIRRRYAFTTSPLGVFTPVRPGQEKTFQDRRSGLQDLLKALPNLNRDQLENLNRALLEQEASAKAAGTPQAQPTFGGDVESQTGGFYGVAAPAGTQASSTTPETPKADRPPVAIRPAGYDAVFQRARDIAGQISPQAETAPTIADAVAEQKQALQAAGYDFNLLKDQMAQIRAEKEQTKADRKEAVNLRLLEAGLGILGGESPYAFVNIGKGASPALKGLSEDIKDIKKIDRERDKALRDLAMAENQVASGMGLGALKTRDAAQERIARANEARATREASIFSTITSAETQRYIADQSVVASKEGKTEQRDDRLVKQAQDAAIKIVNEGTMKFKSTSDREAEISRLTGIFYQQLKDLQSGKVPAATSGPRGRVVNGVYVPAGQ